MAKDFLERLQTWDQATHVKGPVTWEQVENLTRSLEPKTNLVVPKALLGEAPPHQQSRLGRRRGADRQYRCHRGHLNLHIKEFDTHWVVHVDRWNPHLHVVRHLLVDRGFRTFLHIAQLFDPTPAPTPAPAEA